MVYENIVAGAFPFFVIHTTISTLYSGNLWDCIFLLITIEIVGVLKGIFAASLRGDWVMIFMSMYSCLYITSLLPGKIFAICTISKKGWGTSGRKTMLSNYNSLIPVVVWVLIIFSGMIKTLCTNNYHRPGEKDYDLIGLSLYLLFWVMMFILWKAFVQTTMTKKSDYAESVTSSEQETDSSDNYGDSSSESIDDTESASMIFKSNSLKDILPVDGGDEYLSLLRSDATPFGNYSSIASASNSTPSDMLSQSSDDSPSTSLAGDLDTVRHGLSLTGDLDTVRHGL